MRAEREVDTGRGWRSPDDPELEGRDPYASRMGGTSRSRRERGRQNLKVAGIALGALLISLYFAGTEQYFVPSDSMNPRIVKGDRFRADRMLAPRIGPRRGEIWVLRNPTPTDDNGPYLLKRVIALPGETVEVKERQLYVNGKPLNEPYVDKTQPMLYTVKPVTLDKTEYWVLGDNRNFSRDSHEWGPLQRGMFVGRAFLVTWPLGRFGLL